MTVVKKTEFHPDVVNYLPCYEEYICDTVQIKDFSNI